MKTKLSDIKVTGRGDSIVKTTKVFISNKPPVNTTILDFTFA